MKSKKITAGYYTVTDGDKKVSVRYMDHAKKWIAHADWDVNLYTDFLDTKRQAVFNAKIMIEQEKIS